VRAAASFFRVPVGDLVVVHDELDLPFGAIRLKVGGGHAGHNGLRSIVQELGTADFVRLRVGIGRPPRGWTGEVADFVLSDMPPAERAELPQVVERAAKSLVDVVRRGVPHVMNALNRRPKPPRAEAPVASDGRDGGAAPAAAGPAFRKEPGEAGAEAKEDVANGRERR
jgi:PTH1 family peptidyl-tRNA hydrolase